MVKGKFTFKGGEALIEKKESKKKSKKRLETAAAAAAAEAEATEEQAGIGGDVGGKLNKTYEDLFPMEVKRMQARP